MRVLIYSLGLPPFRRGGLVNYTVDLANQLVSNGNTVDFLYPGAIPIFSSSKVKFRKRNTNYKFNCYELINPLPVSLTFGNSINAEPFYEHRDKNKIYKFITKLSPNVVHIHTLMGLPIEFLEVLKDKGIKIIYTTHDYYGLCPKMLVPDSLEKLSNSRCSYDCMLCEAGPSINKIKLMQSHLYQRFKDYKIIKAIRKSQRKANLSKKVYRFNKNQTQSRYTLRKYYLRMFSLIDCFHFNSSISATVFRRYLPKANGKIVPLVINGIPKVIRTKKKTNNVTIGFLGGTDKKKGFSVLKNDFYKLKKENLKFKLLCAGSDTSDSLFKDPLVKNLGIISQKDINIFYSQIDLLVVPSLWHETFGLVVLEAVLNNIPVFCSNLVGSKDILPPDLVFHSNNEFLEKIRKFINNSEYRNRIIKETNNIKATTNFTEHVRMIQQLFY